MRVGIPREVKNHEYRVAITPAGVRELVGHGHEVYLEKDAGAGSGLGDEAYVAAGAVIIPDPDEVWGVADLVLKVKEPVKEEYHRMRPGQVLFTYLHLAADRACTDALLGSKVTGIAYETVQLADGSLPLLAPMSEVAGRLAPQVGAYHLMRQGGGNGVLMGGVPGAYAARVVVIGAGVSGRNAAAIAVGMQANVLVLDKDIARLRRPRPDRGVQRLRDRARGDRRGPGDRRGAGARREGPEGRQQRPGVADEAGLGARGHLDRPGRLLRGLPADNARRPDIPGI